mgnify:CR=1 FL=1
MAQVLTLDTLDAAVKELAHREPAIDVALPPVATVGIDGFLTTPDLVHELRQVQPEAPATADGVWEELFVRRTPLSESCRRVLTLFNKLGFRNEVQARDLSEIRRQVSELSTAAWEARVYTLAHLKGAVRTFRLSAQTIAPPTQQPYALQWELGAAGASDAVNGVVKRTGQAPHHLCVVVRARLPPSATEDAGSAALQEALALCRVCHCPLWLQVDANASVPPLPDASDVRIWQTAHQGGGQQQEQQQQELTSSMPVGTSKMPPSLAYDWMRRMLEQHGTRFVAHSSSGLDTPEQVASAWYHARGMIARTLTEKYRCLLYAGWRLTSDDVRHDLQRLLGHPLS